MHYFGLVRVYSSLSARAAVPLGAPIFFGILVVACIVFGPQGMRAADIVVNMRSSPPFACVMWLGWIVLTFPVARLALVPPSSLYLRWLPVPRTILYASAAFCAFIVEMPFIVLFARGGSLIAGFSVGLGAIALHAAGTTRPYGYRHLLVLLFWAVSAFVPHSPIALGAASCAACVAIKHAIDRAPEVHALARGRLRVHAPAIALAWVHVRYVFRQEPAAIGRMIVLASLAAMSLPLAARGFDLETPQDLGALAWGLSAVALSPALSGLSGAVIRSEQLTAWLADVLGTSARIRVAGAALAMSVLGCGAGVCLGAMAMIFLRPSSAAIVGRISLLPIVWAVCAGSLFAVFARDAAASPKRGDRGMVATLVVIILGIISALQWGERAFVAGLAVAMLGLSLAPKRLERWRRRRGVS